MSSIHETSLDLESDANKTSSGNPLFVDPSQTGSSWVHDLNFSYYVSDSLNLYGGLNNVFDRKPYLGSLSRPAGPRGRFGFIGFKYSI